MCTVVAWFVLRRTDLAKKPKHTLEDHSGSLKQGDPRPVGPADSPSPMGKVQADEGQSGPSKASGPVQVLFLPRAKGTQEIHKTVFEYLKEYM